MPSMVFEQSDKERMIECYKSIKDSEFLKKKNIEFVEAAERDFNKGGYNPFAANVENILDNFKQFIMDRYWPEKGTMSLFQAHQDEDYKNLLKRFGIVIKDTFLDEARQSGNIVKHNSKYEVSKETAQQLLAGLYGWISSFCRIINYLYDINYVKVKIEERETSSKKLGLVVAIYHFGNSNDADGFEFCILDKKTDVKRIQSFKAAEKCQISINDSNNGKYVAVRYKNVSMKEFAYADIYGPIDWYRLKNKENGPKTENKKSSKNAKQELKESGSEENVSSQDILDCSVKMFCKDINIILKDIKTNNDIEVTYSLDNLFYKKEWFPKIAGNSGNSMTFPDYIFDYLKKNDKELENILLHSPMGGAGKTSSLIWTVKELLNNPVKYQQKKMLIPFFIPATRLSNVSLEEYITDRLRGYYPQISKEAIKSELSRPDVHYLVFVDALNECPNHDKIEMQIKDYSEWDHISFVVSYKEPFLPIRLEERFKKIALLPLEKAVIEKTITEKTGMDVTRLDEQMLELLSHPFFISLYDRMAEDKTDDDLNEYLSDAYTLVNHYFEKHIIPSDKNIKTDPETIKHIIKEEFPKECFSQLQSKRKYFSEENGTIKALTEIGLLFPSDESELNKKYFFRNELFFDYFCVKRIYDVFEKKDVITLETLLKQDLPFTIRLMLAQKLKSENRLAEFTLLLDTDNNNVMLQRSIIALYEALSKTITVNMAGRNLWISDFTGFNMFHRCDLTGSNLNPETLWIHDSHIYYDKNKQVNKYKPFGHYVFLSDENGIEIYNLEDDRKVYIKADRNSSDKIINIIIRLSCLLIQTQTDVYIISLENIDELLGDNISDNVRFLEDVFTNKINQNAEAFDFKYLYAIENRFMMLSGNDLDSNHADISGVLFIHLPAGKEFTPLLIEYGGQSVILCISSDNKVDIGTIEKTEAGEYKYKSMSSGEMNSRILFKILSEVAKSFKREEAGWISREVISQFPARIRRELGLDTAHSNDHILSTGFYEVCTIRENQDGCLIEKKLEETCYILYQKDDEIFLRHVEPGTGKRIQKDISLDVSIDAFSEFESKLLSVDISRNGIVLFQYPEYILLFDSNNDKLERINIASAKAVFLENGNIFIESSGIGRVFTTRGTLIWQKTASSVNPEFYAHTKDGIIIKTAIPGGKRVLYFQKKEDETVLHLIKEYDSGSNADADAKIEIGGEITAKEKLEFIESKNNRENCRYEGTDSLGYSYYKCPDYSVDVYDENDVFHCKIYGSAFDYSGSTFRNATMVDHDIDEKTRKTIEQYGGNFD